MEQRRHFGTVRRRESGRWQVMYWYEGRRRAAGTFASKADAYVRLAKIESDVRGGTWIDPEAGELTVSRYANMWLDNRTDLAVRTRELYRYILDRHVFPDLGPVTLAKLAPARIRVWHSSIAKDHPATAAKAYRLLSTIMRTAVIDGLIASTPCKIDGAGAERSIERPIATINEVVALEDAMPDHLRLLVPLATWCQLRRGEILGLRRRDIDVSNGVLHVVQSRTFGMDGVSVTKQPKTAAGNRSLAVPEFLMTAIVDHLKRHVGRDPDALVFNGRAGKSLTRDALQGVWEKAREEVGRPDLRLHDLRHTGLTFAASTGATTVELMHRAGHASAAASMRYQHAIRDRDRLIADALQNMARPGESV